METVILVLKYKILLTYFSMFVLHLLAVVFKSPLKIAIIRYCNSLLIKYLEK